MKLICIFWMGVSFLMLSCCARISYLEPAEGPVATIIVKASDDTINNPVLVHGDQCTDGDADLVGMLNSKAAGMPKGLKELSFKARANQRLSLSMMAGEADVSSTYKGLKVKVSGCRRILDLVPEENMTYEISFIHSNGACYYPVYKTGENGDKSFDRSATIRADCELPAGWSP